MCCICSALTGLAQGDAVFTKSDSLSAKDMEELIEYAVELSEQASYNSEMGNYAEAVRLETEALNIVKEVLGEKHPDYATALSNLASCYACSGDYTEAIRLCTEALNIYKEVLPEKHPDYATVLSNLTIYYAYSGNYTEAIRLGTEALNIRKEVLGENHPDYATSLSKLALFNFKLGNRDSESENILIEANTKTAEWIRKTFATLTADERKNLWRSEYNIWFENTVPGISYEFTTPKLAETSYDATLLAKGILLASDIEFSKILQESGDEGLLKTYEDLTTIRRVLGRLYEKPIAERRLNTDSLERVATSLERDLVERSKAYGDFTRNMSVTWKDVQRNLKAGDVAIEFVSFQVDYDSVMYVAYVLDKKMKNPRIVPLFESRQLNRIPSSDYYSTKELSQLIWGRLDAYIAGFENIYFAPAGELYKIAIEFLPDYKRDGLISDHHNLYRLSSTRELATVKDRYGLTQAVLYGGLTYDADARILEADGARHPESAFRDFALTGVADSLNLRNGVRELPGTRAEVEDIRQTMTERAIYPRLFTGLDGTEGSFKALSGEKISLMHIATHGFYWTASEVRRSSGLVFLMPENSSARYADDNAMTRSGLLLAGANYRLMGKTLPENVPDGILTAKEISELDLRGLDLIVLSACQTGLGEITGDGVFGLQRGFKKAGANTLLMSLWKVDDRATQMLMTRFYEHFLSGKSKLESLALAQKYVREYEEETEVFEESGMTASQRRKNRRLGIEPGNTSTETVRVRPFENPRYWAAFILLDALD